MLFVNDEKTVSKVEEGDNAERDRSDTDPESTDADEVETRTRSGSKSILEHIEDAHQGMKALLSEKSLNTLDSAQSVPEADCPHTSAIAELSKRIVQILHSKSASNTNLASMLDEQEAMYRLEITMGLNIPGSGKVTEKLFAEFVHEYVSPRLDFCTIIDAVGWWKGAQEKVKILYMEMPHSDLEIRKPIFEEIASGYKKKFRQDAVLVSQLETRFQLI